jgi:hypothetical protein
MERAFGAVAFAEAGEGETAVRMSGLAPSGHRWSLNDIFTAVTFAEAGVPEMAKEFLGGGKDSHRPEGAVGFSAAVGLKGVRVWYGVAQVAHTLNFASAVGLNGTRVWYGVAQLPG